MSPGQRVGWKQLLSHAPTNARVLIVDDERDVRTSLEGLVTRFGHQVRTAASAEEADNWLVAERFDAVLLDIELPRMKGVEFLSWALDRDPELAIIMLTGVDDPRMALDCMDQGARTYLVKPVEADFLRQALRDALAVRKILMERNDAATAY